MTISNHRQTLIAAHTESHRDHGAAAVVGQILQPGEVPMHSISRG